MKMFIYRSVCCGGVYIIGVFVIKCLYIVMFVESSVCIYGGV